MLIHAFRPAVLRLVLDCILDLEKEAEQMKLGAPLQAWGVQWLVELKPGAGDMEEFVERWWACVQCGCGDEDLHCSLNVLGVS